MLRLSVEHLNFQKSSHLSLKKGLEANINLRLCGSLGPRRPKMFFGTFLLGKNSLKFLFLRPLPFNDGMEA
jgi:hypothetical protein